MPRYFFDVEIGTDLQVDAIGSELASFDMIGPLALDLCLQVAQERLPNGSQIHVQVRDADGPLLYHANLTLVGTAELPKEA